MVEICGRVCARERAIGCATFLAYSSELVRCPIVRSPRTKSGFLHSVQLGKLTLHLGNYVRRGNVKIISEAHILLLRHAMFFRISQFGAARRIAERTLLVSFLRFFRTVKIFVRVATRYRRCFQKVGKCDSRHRKTATCTTLLRFVSKMTINLTLLLYFLPSATDVRIL